MAVILPEPLRLNRRWFTGSPILRASKSFPTP
jgi:hypothetical protein